MIELKVRVTETAVAVTEKNETVTAGNVNQIRCTFELPPVFDDLIVRAAFNGSFVTVEHGECFAPPLESGQCRLGVYGYSMENGALQLRISPSPAHFYVYAGSYSPGDVEAAEPAPTELETHYSRIKQLVDSGVMTGPKGEPGKDGRDGKDGEGIADYLHPRSCFFDPDKPGAYIDGYEINIQGVVKENSNALIWNLDVVPGQRFDVYVSGSNSPGGVVPGWACLFVDGVFRQRVNKQDGFFTIPDVKGQPQMRFPIVSAVRKQHVRRINVVAENTAFVESHAFNYTAGEDVKIANSGIRKETKDSMQAAYKPYTGKKLVFFGDSITSLGMWTTEFCSLVQPAWIANYARVGATWTYVGSRNDAMKQIETYLTQYAAGNMEYPDAVIPSFGVNDSVTRFNSDFQENVRHFISDTGEVETSMDITKLTNVTDAMRWCVETLRSVFPLSQIFICTPVQAGYASGRAVSQLKTKWQNIQNVCEILSVPCWDTHNCGIYFYEETGDKSKNLANDSLHENEAGGKLHGYYNARKFMNFYCF